MEEINKLISELKEDIESTIWYGRNTEEIEDALTTLKKLKEAIEVMLSCVTESNKEAQFSDSDTKNREEIFNIEVEQLASGCDEHCYFYCTKGKMKNPDCLKQNKS